MDCWFALVNNGKKHDFLGGDLQGIFPWRILMELQILHPQATMTRADPDVTIGQNVLGIALAAVLGRWNPENKKLIESNKIWEIMKNLVLKSEKH